MRDETEALVDDLESSISYSDDPFVKVRELWNFQRSGEDSDVSIRIGHDVPVDQMLDEIELNPNWTLRWLTTPEPTDDFCISMALIYHPPRPDVEGTLLTSDL